MPITNALKARLLDAYFSGTALSAPATVYIGLSTTTPASDGSNFTEPAGGGYARVAVTNNTTNFPSASVANPSLKENGVEITFPQVTAGGDWGVLTHVGVFEANTGGTPVVTASLSVTKNPTEGDTPKVPVGDLDVQLQDPA